MSFISSRPARRISALFCSARTAGGRQRLSRSVVARRGATAQASAAATTTATTAATTLAAAAAATPAAPAGAPAAALAGSAAVAGAGRGAHLLLLPGLLLRLLVLHGRLGGRAAAAAAATTTAPAAAAAKAAARVDPQAGHALEALQAGVQEQCGRLSAQCLYLPPLHG